MVWSGNMIGRLKKTIRVCVSANHAFPPDKQRRRDFADYEAKANSIIGKHKIIAVFAYPLTKLNASEILDIIGRHDYSMSKHDGKWGIVENLCSKNTDKALVESEQRFRLALKNAPVTVAAQDRDLKFLWAYNQRTRRPEEVLGKTDFDIFPQKDAERLSALKRQVIETGSILNEKMWVTSSGKKLYLDLFLEPVKDEPAVSPALKSRPWT